MINANKRAIIELITGVMATLERESMFASRIASLGGTDISEVRLWATGDPYRDIDWPRTLVSGKTHLRLRDQDRAVSVAIAFDVSRSFLLSGSRSKQVMALEVMDIISEAAFAKMSAVSYFLFSDEVELMLLGVSQLIGAKQLEEDIRSFEPHPHTFTDMRRLLQFMHDMLHVPTLIFVLSDFLSDANWTEEFEGLLERHEVIPLLFEDPRDKKGVPGLAHVRGIESGRTRLAYPGAKDEFDRARSFFTNMERAGRIVWKSFSVGEDEESCYERLYDLFEDYRERLDTLSSRSLDRR